MFLLKIHIEAIRKGSGFMLQQIIILLIGLFFSVITFTSFSCKKKVTSANDSLLFSDKAYIIQLSSQTPPPLPANYDDLSRFNFFGICWRGKVDDNLKFIKQLGYSYVMYQTGMENSSLASDLHFYLESPEYQVYPTLGIDRQLVINKSYTEYQINTYQSYFALKNTTSAFPDNIALGWPLSGSFSVEPDWQQQKVIDYFVSQIKAHAVKKENRNKNFLFAGLAWDVPQFTGDFWGDGKQVTLAYWNGKDSSALFRGRTHEFKTYSEGRVAYYLTIRQSLAAEYPGRKLVYIYEPYHLYDSWFKDLEKLNYNNQVQLMENALITQEAGVTKWSTGIEFVDDSRIYKSGIVTKDHVGSTTPDNHDLTCNKLIAGKAAVNGSWVNWYGRFSGSGDKVLMNNIYEVPNWLQLTRVVANWDNLNGVPVANRKWDGSVYSSTNSRIDDDIIYSRQPKTQKLFVVFLNNSGKITLNPGEQIISIKHVDKYFCETIDGTNDIKVVGNIIQLSSN
jgi:hypothetical protein